MFNKKTNEIRRLNEEISRLRALNQDLEKQLNAKNDELERYRNGYKNKNMSNYAWEWTVQHIAERQAVYESNPIKAAYDLLALYHEYRDKEYERLRQLTKFDKQKWDLK